MGTRQGYLLLILLLNAVVENPVNGIQQVVRTQPMEYSKKKEVKGTQMGKEEVNLPLFTKHDMILHVKILKNLQKSKIKTKLSEQIV